MAQPKPLPAILTDPLWLTGGINGASKLPYMTKTIGPVSSVSLPSNSVQTFSKVETTDQKRNKDYHVGVGNPYFIDFANIATPERTARLGRKMLDFAEYKARDWMDNIPTNLVSNAVKGEINPFNATSFFALGSEAVKAAVGGRMTGNLAAGLAGKAGGSIIAGTAVGAIINPTTLKGSTVDENQWRLDLYAEQQREHMARVKMIDEEYGKKMKGKYAGIEMLMETPIWKRDTSPQLTPEERKMQNYEEIIASRYRKLETASRERAKLENGFYNDKGEFMSAHFIRNSQ